MARQDPETSQRILDAARQVFSTKGYSEGRITEIADLANVSPPTIYSYFLGKRDLFLALDLEQADSLRPEFDRKRAQILSQARQLFGERGFHGTTIEKIAQRTGYSKAGLYQFFSSKEELFEAVVHETAFRSDMLQTAGKAQEGDSLPHALARIGTAYLRLFDNPDYAAIFRLVISEAIHYPEIGTIYHEKGIGYAFTQVEQCLRRFHIQDLRPDLDLELLSKAYIALYSYAIERRVAPGFRSEEPEDEVLAAFLTDLFLHGLLPDGHTPQTGG